MRFLISERNSSAEINRRVSSEFQESIFVTTQGVSTLFMVRRSLLSLTQTLALWRQHLAGYLQFLNSESCWGNGLRSSSTPSPTSPFLVVRPISQGFPCLRVDGNPEVWAGLGSCPLFLADAFRTCVWICVCEAHTAIERREEFEDNYIRK
jgi:hypothetical protein